MAGICTYAAEFAHKRSNGSRDLGGNQVNGDDGWPESTWIKNKAQGAEE